MHIEVFSVGDSYVHRVKENVKLAVFAVFAVYTALSHGHSVPSLYLAAGAFLSILARLDFKKVLQRLCVLNMFVIFFWLIIPLSFPDNHARGAEIALSITLKANAVGLLAMALVGTAPLARTAAALGSFGMPNKLTAAFYFSLKYITLLHADYTRTKDAMRARGFRFRPGIRTYKTIGGMLGILLLKSHVYSRKLYDAMLCRGFNGKFPAPAGTPLIGRDYIFTIASASLFIFSLWINQ